jgi:hypothetical protein
VFARRLYRTLPRPLRQLLLRRVSPLTQYRLAVRVLCRRPGWPNGDTDDVTIKIGGRRRRATRDVLATPLSVRQFNLDLVASALDAAGVDYFAIPHDEGVSSRVGVHVNDRAAVLAALHCAVDRSHVVVAIKVRRRSELVWVYRPTATAGPYLRFGSGCRCQIEFWTEQDGMLHAPVPNAVCAALPTQSTAATVTASELSAFVPDDVPAKYVSRLQFSGPRALSVDFPIDAVYTWVDGSDELWRDRWRVARGEHPVLSFQSANESRYADREELRYSLRSINLYAPWIRRIYLVTDDQLPYWLNPDSAELTVVSHRELFTAGARLPTFNSHAIESQLHRIPGLSEHFIYFNDDMFLGRAIGPSTFFHANGVAKFFPSTTALVATGDPTFDELPVTAAGKNNRHVIRQRFGRIIAQKMKHAPYAMRRSVMENIAQELDQHVTRTRDSQFRSPHDLSIASSLHHYWSYLQGTSVPGSLSYLYTDLNDVETSRRLFRLLRRRDFDTFCLNDTDSDPRTAGETTELITLFLEQYFPVRSPLEIPTEAEARRRGNSATELAAQWRAACDASVVPRPMSNRESVMLSSTLSSAQAH